MHVRCGIIVLEMVFPSERLKNRIAICQLIQKIKTDPTGNIKIRLWCRMPGIRDIPSRNFLIAVTCSDNTECALQAYV